MRAITMIAVSTLLVACANDVDRTSNDTVPNVAPARIAPRIVNGSPSTAAQDATVYLGIGDDGACTGTLVTPNLVLTARHCVSEMGDGGNPACGQFTSDLPASELTVRVGVNAPDSAIAARAVKVHRPAGNDGCDDIALVQLDRSLAQKVAPVRFTTAVAGETTTAVGYGENGYGDVPSRRYQRGNLAVKAVGPAFFGYVTKEGSSLQVDVPAKTIATGESTCFGDSGGPLFDASGAVIGVTSRGIDDACVDRPTLYTAVSPFETLIRNAAQASGHPLSTTGTSSSSAPSASEDEVGESGDVGGGDERTPSTTSSAPLGDDDDDGDLDEPSTASSRAQARGCTASGGSSVDPSTIACAIAALLALASRRRNH